MADREWEERAGAAPSAQDKRLADYCETLRHTLESRSVVLMGPNSPFWQCQYCQFTQTTPINFRHQRGCLLSKDGATQEEKP